MGTDWTKTDVDEIAVRDRRVSVDVDDLRQGVVGPPVMGDVVRSPIGLLCGFGLGVLKQASVLIELDLRPRKLSLVPFFD